MIWIPLTIFAAFMQNLRSAAQKRLKDQGAGGAGVAATFARFGFGWPFAVLFLVGAVLLGGPPGERAPGADFWLWTASAAAAQIAATWALLESFDHANFAVGTAFSKTEPLLAAALGAALLSEIPSALAALGIAVGVLGVAGLTLAPRAGGRAPRLLAPKAALLGLLSAALFGFSAVGFRAASLSLGDGAAAPRAALTLLVAMTLQAGALGLWLWAYQREALLALGRAWKLGLAAGAAGAAASAGWFTAMTLEPAAHVRTLAQVEILFTVAVSVFVFRERLSARELTGVALVILGVILLLRATTG